MDAWKGRRARRGEERGEVRGQMGEKLFVGAVYVRIWTYICQCA